MVMVCIRHLRGTIFWRWHGLQFGELFADWKIHLFDHCVCVLISRTRRRGGRCLRGVDGGGEKWDEMCAASGLFIPSAVAGTFRTRVEATKESFQVRLPITIQALTVSSILPLRALIIS